MVAASTGLLNATVTGSMLGATGPTGGGGGGGHGGGGGAGGGGGGSTGTAIETPNAFVSKEIIPPCSRPLPVNGVLPSLARTLPPTSVNATLETVGSAGLPAMTSDGPGGAPNSGNTRPSGEPSGL